MPKEDRPAWQPSLPAVERRPATSADPRIEYDEPRVLIRRASVPRESPPGEDSAETPWWKRARNVEQAPAKGAPVRNTWGAEWNRLLRAEGWVVELPAAKRLAIETAVRAPEVRAGVLEASVGGGSDRPHRVQVRLPPFSQVDWTRLARQVVDDRREATIAADLSRGEIPMALVDAADRHRLTLLPRRLSYLTAACTCGGAQLPCDHLLGLHFVFARRLYREPELLLSFRGMDAGALADLFGRIRAEVERNTAALAHGSGVDPYAPGTAPPPAWELLESPPTVRSPLPDPEGWRESETFDAMVRRIVAAVNGDRK